MPGGRPRKAAAIRELEGNRSRTAIPSDLPLHGTPERPDLLRTKAAREHFDFLAAEFGGCGVLKRADSPALAKLADLWAAYWVASEEGEVSEMVKLSAAWDRAASKLGLPVTDRIKLMATPPAKVDPTEDRFFSPLKVTG